MTGAVPGSEANSVVSDTSWAEVFAVLSGRRSLSREQAHWAMGEVMEGRATPAQMGALALSLRTKGETAEELVAFLEMMERFALRIDVAGPALDIVGTGGDKAHTINVSTLAAVVVRAAGRRVVKHGNRAVSSSCGSADLLEALDVRIDLQPKEVEWCAREQGIAFCFAPVFHPALRHAAEVRRELATPTLFNLLGPLANPAGPMHRAIGVADERMAPIVAEVVAGMGCAGLVFRGDDGLDELTTTTTSTVWIVKDGVASKTAIDPRRMGLANSDLRALQASTLAENVAAAHQVLSGAHSAARDIVLLNAAAGLVAFDPPRPEELEDGLRTGLHQAAEAIDSGRAAGVLQDWAEFLG